MASFLISLPVAGVVRHACAETPPLTPIKADAGETSRKRLATKTAREKLHIKVKRGSGGEYTWELSGGDLGEIIRADKTLRRKFIDSTRQGEK